MNLSIPYEFLGVDHNYEPDFLVSIAPPDGDHQLTLVLEVKGLQGNQEAAKHDGARRWVRAVNNWGKLRQWAFHVCRNPQMLERELAYIVRNWRDSGAALSVDAAIRELGKELPAGTRGTVAGVWQGGRAYEVEFAEPFACLVTVPAGGLAAWAGRFLSRRSADIC